MSTTDRIIDAAIELFNSEGVSHVSLRRIAKEVGISLGNLAYHFNKAEILDEIYSRMEREMDDVVYPGGQVTLHHYHDVIKRISLFHEQYRFFYLDLLEISRHYPRVIRRYRETIRRRFEEHDRLFSDLVLNGLVRKERVPGLYRSLFHAIWVMSTFWVPHRQILGDRHPVVGTGNDVQHVWEIMVPHLTAKGLRELRSIADEEGIPDVDGPVTAMHLRKVS